MTRVNKWFECFDWIWCENVWIKNESVQLKVLNVLAKPTQRFMKIISYNISYFASELEIFDPCIKRIITQNVSKWCI